MIRNVFFDRDGVINEVVFRNEGPGSPRTLREFHIRKEFNDFMTKLEPYHLNFFVVSNQPDVARRLMRASELESMTTFLMERFPFREIRNCVHDDVDQCTCRKPKPGMILGLLKKYRLRKKESIIIGDGRKDVVAGQTAGIKTVFLKREYNDASRCTPDIVVHRLAELHRFKLFGE